MDLDQEFGRLLAEQQLAAAKTPIVDLAILLSQLRTLLVHGGFSSESAEQLTSTYFDALLARREEESD